MKVMTVLGTRPEIIRLSRVIPKLDELCDHILVHTQQNFDRNLSDIFFEQMKVRKPDYHLGASGSLGEQVGKILVEVEKLIKTEKPDKFLVLGDTNSALSVIAAKRAGVPVYHMEAGNRCYDDRVPEEVNRRIIDHCSDVLMPYTERSRANLLQEGISGNRIFVTGNPIQEVIQRYSEEIENSTILNELALEPQAYFLVTMHRTENVDIEERLFKLMKAFNSIHKAYDLPVIISTHPRTQSQMDKHDINKSHAQVRYLPPFGLFDFIKLEKNARLVLSDSGTVQEECCIFHVPNVTIRDVTERPETIECGSNILSGVEVEDVLDCVKTVFHRKPNWIPPKEYLAENVSDTVLKIVSGYTHTPLTGYS
jgi:UDP-N-acetylglucosamine 2-epimerase (non-hydrolysing)